MSEPIVGRVQFDDDIYPPKPIGNSTSRKELSLIERDTANDDHEAKARNIADEDRNMRKKQVFKGWHLAWLAYQSTGVIYGDIGTSPLYVYSTTFTSQPSYDDLLGAVSIIIWSLTLMVSVKYICIVLSADDHGEGGTFALYSLLARYVNIAERDPNVSGTLKVERFLTGEMKPSTKNLRSFIENSTAIKVALKVVGVVGVSMVMADGVLTPAQSILSAIAGLNVVATDITHGTVVGVSCAIIVLLYAVQPFGTTKVASTWAPIVIVWLLFNLITGIYNLVLYDHKMLKAFSPYFAGAYLVRNGNQGWRSLAGLLLAFTGVEALFADIGAFGQRSIQISWLCFAYPCLVITYIGQAAYISVDTSQTAYSNPFFYTVPPGTLWFGLVLAVLAAIVASQAMITSAFQLLSQVMALSYFPHIEVIRKSKTFHGQVYIPIANWLLMIGTVIVTAVFNDTASISNAYGVCVIIVTFITTCMVTFVALLIWRINVFIVLFFFFVFALLDGAYMSAALTKVPMGAWFTLMLAAILSTIFILWRYGKETQWKAEAEDRYPISHFLVTGSNNTSRLTEAFGGHEITTVGGMGIFFDKTGENMPMAFSQFVRKFAARTEVIILFHMRPLPLPSVPESERYVLYRTSIPSCYRFTMRHGYTDMTVSPNLAHLVVTQLIRFVTYENSPSVVGSDGDGVATKSHSPEVQAELDGIERAYAAQTVYVLGKEQMKVRPGRNILRKALLEMFLFVRDNSRTKMASLNIPVDQLIEVSFAREI